MAGQRDIIQRVREIYEQTGLRKSEFAERIGIDGSKLAKSLAGARRFSSLELALIADLAGVTVDWIVTGEKPLNLTLAHRANPATADELDAVAGLSITLLHERVDGLRRIGRPLPDVELPRAKQHGGWVAKSTLLAAEFSSVLDSPIGGLSNPELFDLVEDKLGIDIIVDDLPPGCDGASYSDNRFRGIVLAATAAPFRQRFTLGHEIGHIALGHSRESMIEERIGSEKTLPEKMADTFAASFLAPSAEIRSRLGSRKAAKNFDDLVLHFQVSPSSMSWRLLNEGLVTERERQPLAAETARRIAMRAGLAADFAESAQQSQLRRNPARLVNAYLDAYDDGLTTLRPVASILGSTVEEVEEFFYAPSADDLTGSIEG